ncbi:MAG: hypothetical protein WD772_03695 [Pseudohongiellaceae bacterium]
MLRSFFLSAILGLSVLPAETRAADGSDNMSSACATLEFMAKMNALNLMLPADHDNLALLQEVNSQLVAMNSLVCQSVILTEASRGSSRYANGSLISQDLYYDPWYFPNGQIFMLAPGEDTTIFYPNGVPMSYHWMHGDEALFWPNGRLATNRFRTFDVTWYYPDGNIITYEAGYQGGRWFYPFPRLDGGIGQEVISSEWGIEDERFSYLNFRNDGSMFITRERIRRKLVFDHIDLLDVPGVLLLVTRLYQQIDNARQFVPADANITGAPF